MKTALTRIGQGGRSVLGGMEKAISAVPNADHFRDLTQTATDNAINRVGRPIAEALGQGHKYLGDAMDIGQSYKTLLENGANSAMGFVRDNFGGLMPQGQARQLGYQTKQSRYGGRVITNPDDELMSGEHMEGGGGMGEEQPYTDEGGARNRIPRTAFSSNAKRAGRQQRRETRRSNRSGKGMQFLSNMFGGAMGALGNIGSKAAEAAPMMV